MARFTITALFMAFAATTVLAAPRAMPMPMPIAPDPAGDKNVGNGQKIQFIGGGCITTADCAGTTCCANIAAGGAIGVCSAVAVQNENGKAGCRDDGVDSGVGTIVSTTAIAAPVATSAPGGGSGTCVVNQALAGSQNVGKGTKSQFITGQCFSAADCASGCCAQNAAGKVECRAPLVAAELGLNCNFQCTP